MKVVGMETYELELEDRSKVIFPTHAFHELTWPNTHTTSNHLADFVCETVD